MDNFSILSMMAPTESYGLSMSRDLPTVVKLMCVPCVVVLVMNRTLRVVGSPNESFDRSCRVKSMCAL